LRTYIRDNCINAALIGLNLLYFVWLCFHGNPETDVEMMVRQGALYAPLVLEGQYYRLLTAAFMHFGIRHLSNNMLLLFAAGDRMETALGHVKYLVFYLLSALLASGISLRWHLMTGNEGVVMAGASGAVFAVTGGLLWVLFRNGGSLQGLSSGRLAAIVLLNIYLGASRGGVDNAAHLGGLLSGLVLAALLYRKR